MGSGPAQEDASLGVAWIVLSSLTALVPVYCLPPLVLPLGAHQIPIGKYWSFAFVLTVLLWKTVTRNEGILPWPASPVNWAIAGSVAVGALSLINAVDRAEAASKLGYFTVTGLLVYLLSTRLGPRAGMRVLRAMVVVGAVVAGYGILEYALGRSPIFAAWYAKHNLYYGGYDRASSSIGNPIALGAYLGALAPLAYYLAYLEPKRPGHYLTCALLLGGVGVAFSRAGWVAAAFGIAVFIGRRWRAVLRRRRLMACIAVAAAALMLLFSLLERPWQQDTGDGLYRMLHFPVTEEGRLNRYGTTGNMLVEHPFLGVGFGQYTRVYDRYAVGSLADWIKTSDNMYLMVAGETGLTGLAFFLAILWLVWSRLLHASRESGGAPEKMLTRAYLAAMATMCVNMVFWDPLNHPVMRVVFWMLLGMGMGSVVARPSVLDPAKISGQAGAEEDVPRAGGSALALDAG